MIDWSIRFSDIILFGSMIVGVVVGYVRLQTAVGHATRRADEAHNAVAVVSAKVDLAATHFHDFKVEVAEKYTSRQTIEALEERLLERLDRLTDRVDRVLQRQ